MSKKTNTTPAAIAIAFELSGEIETKSGGVVRTVDPSTFHPETLEAAFVYGVRRIIQDHVNSVAKGIRDSGGEPDHNELFTARLVALQTGELSVRRAASTSSPLDTYRIRVVRQWMQTNGGKVAKGLLAKYTELGSDQQAERRALLIEFAREHAESFDPIAQAAKDKDDADKAAMSDIQI